MTKIKVFQQNLLRDNHTMFHSTGPVIWALQIDGPRYQNKYIGAFQIYFLSCTSKWFLYKTFLPRIWPRGYYQTNFSGYILGQVSLPSNQFQDPTCIIQISYQILPTVWGIPDIRNACVVRPTPIFRWLTVMMLTHTSITLLFVFRLVVMVGIKHGTFS